MGLRQAGRRNSLVGNEDSSYINRVHHGGIRRYLSRIRESYVKEGIPRWVQKTPLGEKEITSKAKGISFWDIVNSRPRGIWLLLNVLRGLYVGKFSMNPILPPPPPLPYLYCDPLVVRETSFSSNANTNGPIKIFISGTVRFKSKTTFGSSFITPGLACKRRNYNLN
jgi:hypothetical protein